MPLSPVRTPTTRPLSNSALAAGVSVAIRMPFSSAMPAIQPTRSPSERMKLPWFWSTGGTNGSRNWPVGHRNITSSPVTSAEIGQPRSRKSGISSRMPRGSMTAPEIPCAPTRDDFSSTAIVVSGIAAPAPPAATARL